MTLTVDLSAKLAGGTGQLETTIEISRAVSMLRSVIRGELETCVVAVDSGDAVHARKQLVELGDKLKRIVNVLNGLR